MNNTLVEYVAVIMGNGPYYALLPDFSLIAIGDTREAAMSSLRLLVDEGISVLNDTSKAIPRASSRESVEAKWSGNGYIYSSVSVWV